MPCLTTFNQKNQGNVSRRLPLLRRATKQCLLAKTFVVGVATVSRFVAEFVDDSIRSTVPCYILPSFAALSNSIESSRKFSKA